MKNEKLLKDLREDFEYFIRYWKDIRAEGDTDMRCVSGDPWDTEEKRLREAAHRPCVVFDELGQYTNQLINDVRQNKRAVKVDPAGGGATDKTAEFRAGLIRQIEYASKAQAVYANVMENVTQRSYGFARVSKRHVAPDSFDQELVILPIKNPNAVWDDPDAKLTGRSDRKKLFIVDTMRVSEFKRRWPKAEVTSFSSEMIAEYPLWLKEDSVQVAEAWRVESTARTLYSLDIGGGLNVFKDELDGEIDGERITLAKACDLGDGVVVPRGKHQILNERESAELRVVQYITNGVEILEEVPQDGVSIPVAACYGKEKYVDEGGGSKLRIESLVRPTRDPFMAYCYAQTTGMELLGMMPKSLLMAYEGQFEGHEDEVAQVGRVPIPFLYAKAKTEATGETVLPLPTMINWQAPLAMVESMAESYKRAIQSSMGMYNTSVGKHDTAAQSGVAVRALDDQSSQGSFHFIDNFDGFLEDMGRLLDEQIDYVYDTPRWVGTRNSAGEHRLMKANERFTDPQTGETYHYQLGSGRHSVSITTGPSSNSQRDAASEFADQLAQNQMVFPRIADLVVKLKNLGPIGDAIADRLKPADIAAQEGGQGGPPVPPQVQQLMTQQKQQLMQQAAVIAELQKQLDAKLPEIQSKQFIATMQEVTKRQDIEAQVRIAELQAGVASAVAKLEQQVGAIQHSVDTANSQADRDHEAMLATQQQGADAAQAAQNPAGQAAVTPATGQPSTQ